MLFPRAALAASGELPAGARDGPVAAAGSAVGGVPCGYGKKTEIHPRIARPLDSGFDGAAAITGPAVTGLAEDDPGAGGGAAGAADVPPGLLT
jgi:hypothetical protein